MPTLRVSVLWHEKTAIVYTKQKTRSNTSRLLWAKMDSNHRSRKTADLQSAPFGHSGICPDTFRLICECKSYANE